MDPKETVLTESRLRGLTIALELSENQTPYQLISAADLIADFIVDGKVPVDPAQTNQPNPVHVSNKPAVTA